MKKLLLLLALISTFAFGIDKKTPTGGTVKDKPGKSQERDSIDPKIFKVTGSFMPVNVGGAYNMLTLTLNKGTYIVSYSHYWQIGQSARDFSTYLTLAGTQISTTLVTSWIERDMTESQNAATRRWHSDTVPIYVANNGTTLALVGAWVGATAAGNGVSNMLSALLIP